MPWDVGSPPDAAKKYSPRCQRAFVHAANSVLDKTGDDGRAIAAGHAAAKQCEGSRKSMSVVQLSKPDELPVFKVFVPTLICSRDTAGNPRVEGIASSTAVDRHGDKMTLNALRKMESSAQGLTIFLNHEYRVPQDVFGTVRKAWITRSGDKDPKTGDEIYDLRVAIHVAKSNPAAMQTFELLEDGQSKLGISVGGHVPDGGAGVLKNVPGGRYLIDDVDLDEASIVGIPAHTRAWTYYVTKGLDKVFKLEKEQISGQGVEDDAATDTGANDEPAAEDVGEREAEESEAEEGDAQTGGEIDTVEKGFDLADYDDDGFLKAMSADTRNNLKDSDFACPEKRKYPIHDKAHVRAALSRIGDPSNDQCGKEKILAAAKKFGIKTDDEKKALLDEGEALPIVKSTISIWELADGSKTVEVNTGRKPKAGANLSSQAVEDQSDDEGGDDAGDDGGVIKSGAPDAESTEPVELVKALHGQVRAKEAENTQLRDELNAAIQLTKSTVETAARVFEQLGRTPMGRKTEYASAKKAFTELEERTAPDLSRLVKAGIYDEEMTTFIQKGKTQ